MYNFAAYIFLVNTSCYKHGKYIFTFSKHFCVRNRDFKMCKQSVAITTVKTHFSIITPTQNVHVAESSNLYRGYNVWTPIYVVDLASYVQLVEKIGPDLFIFRRCSQFAEIQTI